MSYYFWWCCCCLWSQLYNHVVLACTLGPNVLWYVTNVASYPWLVKTKLQMFLSKCYTFAQMPFIRDINVFCPQYAPTLEGLGQTYRARLRLMMIRNSLLFVQYCFLISPYIIILMRYCLHLLWAAQNVFMLEYDFIFEIRSFFLHWVTHTWLQSGFIFFFWYNNFSSNFSFCLLDNGLLVTSQWLIHKYIPFQWTLSFAAADGTFYFRQLF